MDMTREFRITWFKDDQHEAFRYEGNDDPEEILTVLAQLEEEFGGEVFVTMNGEFIDRKNYFAGRVHQWEPPPRSVVYGRPALPGAESRASERIRLRAQATMYMYPMAK